MCMCMLYCLCFFFQFVKIFDSFMNKDGIKCLKFYYQDSVMPGIEGKRYDLISKLGIQ